MDEGSAQTGLVNSRWIFVTSIILLLGASSLLATEAENWPREVQAPNARVVMFQPQVESLYGNDLKTRAAVSVTRTGETTPVFGAVWSNARIDTDRDTRTVTVRDVNVQKVRFPEATPEDEQALADLLEREIPKWDLTMSLDRLLTMLDLADRERFLADKLNNDPPDIRFVTYPAVLVMIEGEPRLFDIENSNLRRVANTAFLIVNDPRSRTYFLYSGNDVWMEATEIEGPWAVANNVPPEIAQLSPIEAEKEAQQRAAEEAGEEGLSEESGSDTPPAVVIAVEPTELIVTEGSPQYQPIPDSMLLYVSNTESDVLLEIDTQLHYVLLSGRWFAAPSLNGPWKNVPSDELPSSFSEIPADSEMGHVRVWVAGTEEAKEAILDTQIPQTAAISRDATIEVEYYGRPQFEAVEETNLQYAVNTTMQVLRHGSDYFAVEEGVWYVSDSPTGPWEVSTETPPEIENIPPTSPMYNTKFVRVYDVTPQVVYVGHFPGYTHTFVHRGCIVFGTGWWFHPFWGPTVFIPRHSTWGWHVRWHPWWGWSFGFSHRSVRFSFGIGFHPWSHPGWWGPVGWHSHRIGWHSGWHHGWRSGWHRGWNSGYQAGFRAGARAGARVGFRAGERTGLRTGERLGSGFQGPNLYRGPQNRERLADLQARRPETRPTISRDLPNNVLAERDGSIARRASEGGFQQRQGNNWSRNQISSPNRQRNLNLQNNARQRGNIRSGQLNRTRAGGGGRLRR